MKGSCWRTGRCPHCEWTGSPRDLGYHISIVHPVIVTFAIANKTKFTK